MFQFSIECQRKSSKIHKGSYRHQGIWVLKSNSTGLAATSKILTRNNPSLLPMIFSISGLVSINHDLIIIFNAHRKKECWLSQYINNYDSRIKVLMEKGLDVLGWWDPGWATGQDGSTTRVLCFFVCLFFYVSQLEGSRKHYYSFQRR